ncbi:MAG: hypothetical protein ACNA8S_02425 [Deferrisomatales bacterium]
MKSSILAVVIGTVLLLAGCGGSGSSGGVGADGVDAIGNFDADSGGTGANLGESPAGGTGGDLGGDADGGLGGQPGDTGGAGDAGDGNSASVDPILVDERDTGDPEVECWQAWEAGEVSTSEFTAWYKVDTGKVTGTWDLDGRTVYMDVAEDGGLYWEASDLIGAVIVKGGSGANAYLYPGGEVLDSGLTAPINPSNGKPYGISHVTFCWSAE